MNFGDIKSFVKDSNFFKGFDYQQQAIEKERVQAKVERQDTFVHQSSQLSITNKIVMQTMADKMGKKDALPAEQDFDGGFDFETIANNVMQFVEGAVLMAKQNGASDDELQHMLGKAKEGIEQGFAEAKEILNQMNLMNEEIETGIAKSYDLIQERMGHFEEALFGKPDEVGPEPFVPSKSVSIGGEIDYQRKEAGDLTITTAEGDKVSFSFSSQVQYTEAYNVAAQFGEGGGQASGYYEQSFYQAVGFSFTVEGDLNEEEQEAIANLVNDISKLSDDFFNGDIDKAFQQALDLGYDESQIVGFALNLSYQEQVKVTQTYQEVSNYQPQEAPVEERPKLSSLMPPLNSYLKDLLKVVEEAKAQLENMDSFDTLASRILHEQMQPEEQDKVDQAIERFRSLNIALLKNLPEPAPIEDAE
ncbi:DUF5610 domain-containing protein [Algicola sagamiensis]|uniref:DUF5610 domain-containing protein n=1 Tax=Algicola sagamiensis TaxID=163869 RepID=UPI00035FB5C1|nr:DUF5610 domain-containing protein [Algicola sagamiensis]